MPGCSLIVRRRNRRTNNLLEPNNERGDVIDVVALGIDHGRITRELFAIIEVPDMTVRQARSLFLESDWAPGPLPDGHRRKEDGVPVRQRSIKIDDADLRTRVVLANQPRIDRIFSGGRVRVRDEDRPHIGFNTLRRSLVVKRDLALEVAPDQTIRRRVQTINQPDTREPA